jgi:hypothetical protein
LDLLFIQTEPIGQVLLCPPTRDSCLHGRLRESSNDAYFSTFCWPDFNLSSGEESADNRLTIGSGCSWIQVGMSGPKP